MIAKDECPDLREIKLGIPAEADHRSGWMPTGNPI
jgi:hypothetical protein